VHGSPSESNLGRTEDALADFKKAAALLEKAAASGSGPEVLAPLAQVYDQTARVLKAMGRKVEANECYRKSINIREQLFNQNPHSLEAQRALAAARFTAARMEIDAGNLRPALDLARRSLGEYEAAVAADPAHAQTRFALALNAKTLAAIETQLGDFNAAERYAARALEIDRARLAASPEDANIPLDISFDLSERAEAEIGRRDFMAALSDYRQALELREGLLRQDPNNERLRDRTAYVSGKIGLLLMDMGRTPEAQPHVRRQYALLQPLAADANNVTRRVRFAEARGNLGAWYCQSGQKDRGRGLLASAIAEITDMRESQRITYSDMLPLARLQADAKACGLASAASQE
jgi:tetratricopeptide (TPR) repeat protein